MSVMRAAGVAATWRCSIVTLLSGGAIQQTLQGGDRFLGPSQAGLQAGQMAGDHPVAGLDVGSLKHNVDVLERHVKVAESADDLRRSDLLWCVAPVSAVGIHVDRLQ